MDEDDGGVPRGVAEDSFTTTFSEQLDQVDEHDFHKFETKISELLTPFRNDDPNYGGFEKTTNMRRPRCRARS